MIKSLARSNRFFSMRRLDPGVVLIFAALAPLATSAARGADELQYNRDIRPILADNCFACHGPDSAARKADLRLDQREAAIDMAAIAPHAPEDSELVRRIMSADDAERMPPPETKKTLTDEQKQKLTRWIEQGADYELHWSFIPPTRPEPPAPSEGFADWPQNPIDNFILAKMQEEGLSPAPQADRRKLARRLSLDLTGLPPSPALVDEFEGDTTDNAYEKLVDKLLASQSWGEHRGRYWLDYARYADTHGIHFDNYREMWSYRDWVIKAFNQNMPYDQFTIENLAGDLLPNPTLDQLIASGFNRCNMTTNEGGIIDEEYQVLYTRDRVETTSLVWLGLTAGCAVCHSHKFDPLSQREFYELAAFFNNTTQKVRDGNVKDTPPIVNVPDPADRARWRELNGLIAEAQEKVAARRREARGEFDQWLAAADPESLAPTMPSDKAYLHAPLDEGEGKAAKITVAGEEKEVALAENAAWENGPFGKAIQVQGGVVELSDAADFQADEAFTCAAWIKMPASDGSGAICARMDIDNKYRGWDFWTQRRQIGVHVINEWPEKGLKVVGAAQIEANKWTHVAVTYDGSGKAAGVKVYYNGAPQEVNVENDKLSGSISADVAFKIGQRSTGQAYTGSLQDLRIYNSALSAGDVAALANSTRYAALLAKPAEKRSDQEENELYDFWLAAFDAMSQQLVREQQQLQQEQNAIRDRGTIAHVMQEKDEPAMAYVLARGEYDKRGDEVKPGVPEVLPGYPDDFGRDRLGLAQWLLLPEQPLTARVTVNRFWQEVFGAGLVKTSGDFGVMGELPSHPELLDWLAVEFRESGWDVKELFKLMVMSATYQQSAAAAPEKIEKDPSNRLLWRGPRFRMDAEMVRDYALSASGLLVPKIGGPSVKPYQPPGVWEAIAMNVSNTKSYEVGAGDDLYRRSLYTFVKRMAPPASMDIFNAPNREYCVVRRERTNTPLQALVTLNDEQFVEAARHLAQIAIREGGDEFNDRLDVISQRLLSRRFHPEEIEIIKRSLDELVTYYQSHEEDAKKLLEVGESKPAESIDPATLAAWTMLANELMNLDEVLNK